MEEPFQPVRGKWLLIGMLVVLVGAAIWLARELYWRFPSDHGRAAAEAEWPDRSPDWACVIGAIDEGGLPGTTLGWKIEVDDQGEFEIVTPFYRYRAAVADGQLIYVRGFGWRNADVDAYCDDEADPAGYAPGR